MQKATTITGKNHSDNNDSTFGNNSHTNTNFESNLIGESLLSFLPSDGNKCVRQHDRNGNFPIHEVSKAEKITNSTAPNGNKNSNNEKGARFLGPRNQRRRGLSLILDGKASAVAISNRNTSSERDTQKSQKRKTEPKTTSRSRILLQGPPRSGKSCLSMDLAYAEAAADTHCCGGLPCNCVATIVYRPFRKSSNDNNDEIGDTCRGDEDKYGSDNDRFPLFCRALPAQRSELNRPNTSTRNLNDQTKERSEARASDEIGMEALATTTRDEDSWDVNALNRIRICRVSSIRDIWEDMLILTGKPIHEQPRCAIIVEDVDQIIESGGGLSNRNRNGNFDGNSKKNYNLVDLMLKTVAIAANTALEVEKSQSQFQLPYSDSNTITLLFTLTVDPSQQHSSGHNVRATTKDAIDLSKAIILASCIDTVVTLRESQSSTDNMTLEPNKNDAENASRIWQNKNEEDASGDFFNRTLLVNSVWKAEIRERTSDQDFCNVGEGFDANDVSLVEYAFVESMSVGAGNMNECESVKELRWKTTGAIF